MSILRSRVNPMSRTDKTLEEVALELVEDNEKKASIIEKLVKEIALLKAELARLREAEDDGK